MKSPEALSPQLNRRRPRAFLEWRALRRWGKLPDREAEVPGYLLRIARENTALTQGNTAFNIVKK